MIKYSYLQFGEDAFLFCSIKQELNLRHKKTSQTNIFCYISYTNCIAYVQT